MGLADQPVRRLIVAAPHERVRLRSRRARVRLRREVQRIGGESGIRTREAGFSRLHTFQACSFNRSDTSPLEPGMAHCRDIPGRAV